MKMPPKKKKEKKSCPYVIDLLREHEIIEHLMLDLTSELDYHNSEVSYNNLRPICSLECEVESGIYLKVLVSEVSEPLFIN
jgi:hypothetical protein